MKSFIEKLRRTKISQIIDVWKLPLAVIIAPFYKIRHKDLWIICDSENEARDNGYWMFKYVRENHANQECVFAIHRNSFDYSKVEKIGKAVEYGSLMHWIMYLASTKKISSQKAGNPNAALFYFLEVYGLLKDTRIFLQHGVIKDDLKWLYYNVTKMKRFICGAYPEYEYIVKTFGYPEGYVNYTGLARYDGLHDYKTERIVLIMPTWREWIADEDYRLMEYEGTTNIPDTNYFRNWNAFLNDNRIAEIAKMNHVKFVFFPHRNMQKYMEYFPKNNEYLTVMSGKDIDIQVLLKKSALMITDYSSVYFDFLYMKKPVIFYQFDYEVFRKGQYGEGYFDYHNNPFGKSFENSDSVFNEIESIIKNDFKVSSEFLEAHNHYFPKYDTNNCKRIFDIIQDCK